VYVNALTGGVEAVHSEIHSAKNRAVYSGNNTTSLPGTLKRSEGGAVTGDAHVDGNYDHLGTTYDCYSVNFGRDSYNGSGAQLRSTVHHSTNYTNAFWNGAHRASLRARSGRTAGTRRRVAIPGPGDRAPP
jgi:Zn-dependent metalloprotease